MVFTMIPERHFPFTVSHQPQETGGQAFQSSYSKFSIHPSNCSNEVGKWPKSYVSTAPQNSK